MQTFFKPLKLFPLRSAADGTGLECLSERASNVFPNIVFLRAAAAVSPGISHSLDSPGEADTSQSMKNYFAEM